MAKFNSIKSNFFYGNEVSDYGKEYGYVDYRTLAKAFDAVLNNGIMDATAYTGFWELWNGSGEYREDADGAIYTAQEAESLIDDLQGKLDEIEDEDEREEIENRIESLEEEHCHDIFQWFIISDAGAQILADWTDEIVYYNEPLDMYLWGVTHRGTSWDYVLTDIKIERREG